MKAGATLSVSFHLTTAITTDGWGHDFWGIGVDHARIENTATGVAATEFPDTSPSGLTVSAGGDDRLNEVSLSLVPNSAFDPSVPSCPKDVQPGNFPLYQVILRLDGDGTLKGVAKLICFAPGDLVFDSQAIIVRRI
jgi:hypothetical protein